MHWLAVSSPNGPLNGLRRSVGALDDGVTIRCREPFVEYGHAGASIRLYRDVDATRRHLTALSPDDAGRLKGSAKRSAGCRERRRRVEVRDVATPLTYERCCGSWRGSWMSGIRPGGLSPAMLTGRAAVEWLCRDMDTAFVEA